MARASPVINNFIGGEISPLSEARVDIPYYHQSCKILENNLALPQGGSERRPGTPFVAKSKTAGKRIRLIPFEYSVDIKYILEFGNQYIRVFKDHAPVMGNGDPYEVSGSPPYLEAELREIQYIMIGTVLNSPPVGVAMYLFHPNHAPRQLLCSGDANWNVSTLTLTGWDTATEKSITGATKANPVVITAAAHGYLNDDIVRITEVEGMVEINCKTFKVAGKTDNTFQLAGIDGTDYSEYLSGGKVVKQGQVFNSAGDYPSCVDYYGDAIYVGATNNNPNQYWRSKIGEYKNFAAGINPADAFTNKIGTKKGVRIRNLVGKNGMFIGTNIGEYIIPLDSDGIITPASLPSDIQTWYGSKNLCAEIVNDTVLFFQRGGKRLREYIYSAELSGYHAPDLTFIADHITESGVVEMAVQTEPQTILWCVTNDGRLISLTYERQYGIVAWSPHPMLATKTENGTTPATVESVAVLPGGDDVEDEIWISVLRCDPDNKRYIEYFKPRAWGSDQADCFFVDSGVTWDGGAKKDISTYNNAKPIQITSTGHGLSNGEFVKFSDIIDTDETPLDYTVFTEDDTPGRLTVAKNKITITDFDRDEAIFVSKDCGTAFFSEDFEFMLDAKLSAADEDAIAGIWGLANAVDGVQDIISASGDCLCVSVKRKSVDSKYYIELLEVNGGSPYTSEYEISFGSTHYLTIERDEDTGDYGKLYCYIYSDASRSNLLQMLELSLHAKIDYRYLFAFQSHEYGTGDKSLSGEINNLWGDFYRESLNYLVFKVANSAANTFDLNDEDDNDVDGFFHKEYVSGGKIQKVTKSVSDLGHLEGQLASVIVDGGAHPDKEVSTGAIDLENYANKIHAGLEFDSKLMPVPLGHPGKKKRVVKLLIWFYKTLGCKAGPDGDHLQPVTFRKQSDPMDSPPPLYTGKLEPPGWPDGYDEDANMLIVQDQPFPMTILALMPEYDTNE